MTDQREAVARIIDPRLADVGWMKNYRSYVDEVQAIALSKADQVLALLSPYSSDREGVRPELPCGEACSGGEVFAGLNLDQFHALELWVLAAAQNAARRPPRRDAKGPHRSGGFVMPLDRSSTTPVLGEDWRGSSNASPSAAPRGANTEAEPSAAQDAQFWKAEWIKLDAIRDALLDALRKIVGAEPEEYIRRIASAAIAKGQPTRAPITETVNDPRIF